jgi:glycogen(starch) synthase
VSKLPKPHSEPPSPSISRSSTPPPSTNEAVDDDEPDSEDEREQLSKPETPTGRLTPNFA